VLEERMLKRVAKWALSCLLEREEFCRSEGKCLL